MKKFHLLVAFVAIAMSASAQEIISVVGRLPQFVPGELTVDGKSRMYFRTNRNEGGYLYNIYNENMELETTFEIPVVSFPRKTRIETATVPGTATWNYDASNAVWSLESEEVENVAAYVSNIDDFYNMDMGICMNDCDIEITQTLFNNDENWEYMANYSQNTSYINAVSYDANTGTVLLRRTSYIVEGGIRIYNQHGQLVKTIDDTDELDAILIAKGKKYVTTHNTDKVNGEYLNKVFLVNDSGSNSGKISQVRGDINNDGTVSMPDAMFIVNKMLNGKFPDEDE